MSFMVLPTTPITNYVTAAAGGAYANSPQLTLGINEVTTVVTAGDSVQAPPANIGGSFVVINSGAAGTTGLKIWGQAANAANGGVADQFMLHGSSALTPAATGVALAAGHCSWFACTQPGVWKQIGDFS